MTDARARARESLRRHRVRKREGKRIVKNCDAVVFPGCRILTVEIAEADAELWLEADGLLSSNEADNKNKVDNAVRLALMRIGNQISEDDLN
jgi:hypothetical protein